MTDSPRLQAEPEPTRILSRFSAFISYAREDERLARRIATRLERFRVPPSLEVSREVVSSGRLLEVFVDYRVLKPGELSKEIKTSLQSSDSLIVLCTPNAATSEWMEFEYVNFIAAKGANRVFCVIPDARFTKELPIKSLIPAFIPNGQDMLLLDTRHGALGQREWLQKLVAAITGSPYSALKRRLKAGFRKRVAAICAMTALLGATASYAFAGYREFLQKQLIAERALSRINKGLQLEGAPLAALAAAPPRNLLLKFFMPGNDEALIASGLTTPIVYTSAKKWEANNIVHLNDIPLVIAQGLNGDTKLIDSTNGKIVGVIDQVTDKGWSIDNDASKILFTSEDGSHTLFYRIGGERRLMQLHSDVESALLNKIRDIVVTTNTKGKCEYIDPQTGILNPIQIVSPFTCRRVRSFPYSPYLVISDENGDPFIVGRDGSIFDKRRCDYLGVGFADAGHCIVGKDISFFNLKRQWRDHPVLIHGVPNKVVYSSNPDRVLIQTNTGEVSIVDIRLQKVLFRESVGHVLDIGVSDHPSYGFGRYVNTLVRIKSSLGTRIYSVERARLLAVLPVGLYESYIASADRTLFGFSTGQGPVYSGLNGRLIIKLAKADETIDQITFSYDSSTVVYDVDGGYGGILNLNSRKKVVTFPFTNEDGGAKGRFSGDSNLYVSNSDESGADVWNARTGALLARLAVNDGASELDVGVDGKTIATSSANGQLVIWRLDPSHRFETGDAYVAACKSNRRFLANISLSDVKKLRIKGRDQRPCDIH